MKASHVGLIIALITLSWCAYAANDEPIRVGLVRYHGRVASVTVSSPGGVTVADSGGAEIASCGPAESVVLSSDGGAITIKRGLEVKPVSGPYVRLSPSDGTSVLHLTCLARSPRDYRGIIEARPKSWGLQLVNVLSVEDYLRGVVPEEMPSGYPPEAIKAQAIAARTFALRNRGKHNSEGYDVCDTTNCQLYGGVQAEKPRSTEAIDATKGIVLTYAGQLASVMYSADCGGVTDNGSGKQPYLCFVTEPAGISHCSWEVTLTLDELGRKLAEAEVKGADGVSMVRVSQADQSGRAVELELTTPGGIVLLSGSKFRGALAKSGVKSQLFTMAVDAGGNVTISGKGAGHGVGLCQVGAKWLAGSPQDNTCRKILAHYFPGTDLTQIGAPSAPPVATAKPTQPRKPIAAKAPDEPKQVVARKIEVKQLPAPVPSETPPVTFDVRLDAPDGL